MGTYTDTDKVEGITQFTDSGSTDPTTTQIEQWITEVEADLVARGLGSHAISEWQHEDIEHVDIVNKDTIEFIEYVQRYGWSDIKGVFWFPAFLPLVSVQNLEKRTTNLDQTASYTELTEGPGSGSDFIIIKRKTKTGKYLGIGVYFYSDDKPLSGPLRIRVKYTHGWNIDGSILTEWATLKVALKVLGALMEANVPYGADSYGVLDINVGVEDMERKRKGIYRRIAELEDKYFPKDDAGGVAFF